MNLVNVRRQVTQRAAPSTRPSYLQATRSRPSRQGHDPQAWREKAFNRGGGKGGARSTTPPPIMPPKHPNDRCPRGPPGPRGNAQASPTQRSGWELATTLRGQLDPSHCTATVAAATGEAINIRRPPILSSLGRLHPDRII
ncbi:hypothetical protein NDU88_004711 [Pleurodeles waltl]|uniref:Uncharacterized protein n=1 Tax=Pleurodeles waltl TaxID=8319 RepID=A0AAV7TV40_PLEWA|nr:hypothetical protein NDU88_004711 [Pleurodeles waltl]